jgi:hypothetical protein
MKAPLAVSAGTDDGKGLLLLFSWMRPAKYLTSTYREIDASEIDWPVRMKIEAADGESVTGIIRARSIAIQPRFFPHSWNEPR